MRIGARWIWDGREAPFPGTLRIEGGRIREIERTSSGGDLEFPDAVVLPGFVNAHCHLDLTFSPRAEAVPPTDFTHWLLSVVETRRREGREGLERAAAQGIEESLASGTTFIVDYDSGGFSPPALARSPIRRLILREVIGFQPDAARLSELEAFLPAVSDPEREARGLAPHAPYTVHPELLRSVIALARRYEAPWSMHVCEQRYENEFLQTGAGELASFLERAGVDTPGFPVPGVSTIEYLERNGWLRDAPLLVHGNYLDGKAIARLARRAATIVFCPRSHAHFGHPRHPLPRLIEAGVPVVVGTDGKISSGTLSILDELRHLHRAFPDLDASAVLELATVAPRRFLRRARVLAPVVGSGRLGPGEPADLAVVSVNAVDSGEVPRNILESDQPCVATIVAGDVVHGMK